VSLIFFVKNKKVNMIYSTDPLIFLQEQSLRLPSYYSSNRAKFSGFGSKDNFINWYLDQIKNNDCKCHYCKVSILEVRLLLNNGVIHGRSVKGNGLRGPNFEIDRKNPVGQYDVNNCVLSCYFCNNDKSNTFDYTTYLNVIGPVRAQIWKVLLDQLRAV
jgi:hypothetical protein